MVKMDTEIWPCTFLSCTKQYAMTWTACCKKEVGSGIFVLVRCTYGVLRSTTSFQVVAGQQIAGHRWAGSYSRPVQIDGDAVSMTRGRVSEAAWTGVKEAKVDHV